MLQIYDSRLKKKVEFKPLKKGEVGMYVCGPTVYDKAHLGHGRSAVSFDVVRKYLEYKGYKVLFVSNYTDIDDKMINRAKEEGISVEALADKVIPIYERDYEALGIKKPDIMPKATEHVKEIIELIKKLEKAEYTYVLEDGVCYDVSKYPAYGELSGQSLEELKMGARIDVNESKRNPYDFVLWKFKKEGEPAWQSPWGEGRPGWHIECSAMTWKHLGEKFDIHGGGLDLKFPHHECEAAQSCGAFGKGTFAQYWIHNGFIQVNNEKMSKSLGNFFTLEDIFAKYDPQVVRFMFLQTHYRNPINFSDQLLEQAKASLERIHGFVRVIETEIGSMSGDGGVVDFDKYKKDFENSMDNDFDTSGALSVVFDLVKEANTLKTEGKLSKSDAEKIMSFLKGIDSVLGIISPRGEATIDSDVQSMITQREEARKNKDFKKSDEIRAELLKKGIVLEDTPNGTIWKKG
ncbi:MAG: cysteine--tRNA ligase [Candidatus Gracilibacteria bacterium]|jgi:cysteinyl-tRNA synthetase